MDIMGIGHVRRERNQTPGLLKWPNTIFCMEKKHVRRIKEKYPDIIDNKKIVCLNISDDYEFMDRELQELLKSYVYEYIC